MNKKIKELIIDNYFSAEELKFLAEIDKIEKISNKEAIELVKLAQAGDKEARDKLIRGHLRNVAGISASYIDRGLDFLDLVQEGTLGLMKAIDKFDLKAGESFRYYASIRIKSPLGRAIDEKGRTIRFPAEVNYIVSKIDKVKDALKKEYNREATKEEIARALGYPVEKIDNFLALPQCEVSLFEPVSNDDNTLLIDTIPDKEDFFGEVERVLLHGELMESIGHDLRYDFRTRDVLMKRYGLEDGDSKSYDEIAADYGLSRERIKQIEAKGLQKLRFRSSSKTRKLRIH